MSSHVFSLLFKVLLNSTLSWWKTICFVGLVLLRLNAGLGKHQSRHMGVSGTGSRWGERKRDWGTRPHLALLQFHKLPVSKWGLFPGSIFRPLPPPSP